jgi:hypothetical protein
MLMERNQSPHEENVSFQDKIKSRWIIVVGTLIKFFFKNIVINLKLLDIDTSRFLLGASLNALDGGSLGKPVLVVLTGK